MLGFFQLKSEDCLVNVTFKMRDSFLLFIHEVWSICLVAFRGQANWVQATAAVIWGSALKWQSCAFGAVPPIKWTALRLTASLQMRKSSLFQQDNAFVDKIQMSQYFATSSLTMPRCCSLCCWSMSTCHVTARLWILAKVTGTVCGITWYKLS